ncbi:MAG: hypothetical protein AUH85_14435 [Chloroflexi bacterium 13_1_40CM_4_68_4]|nr:MAG: hypothetical protein AUH85_14435 [Chloroflexi bacterium 13_1_40CM_4_68_4]
MGGSSTTPPTCPVSFGSRVTATDADGRYAIDNVPRSSKIDTMHRYYGKHTIPPDQTELRLTPLTITFEVHDVYTGKGVDTPEARQPDDTQIGKGTATGEMVVGPYPAPGSVLICAKDYQGQQIRPAGYQMNVDLSPSKGSDCPPLKSPPATPSPSPSAAPSGSGSPSPSASPSPSGTP